MLVHGQGLPSEQIHSLVLSRIYCTFPEVLTQEFFQQLLTFSEKKGTTKHSKPDIPKLCSAKHLQVLRKEIGKKNKILVNVTRSENCEFVRP